MKNLFSSTSKAIAALSLTDGMGAKQGLRLGRANDPLRHDQQILGCCGGLLPTARADRMVKHVDKLRALQPFQRGGKGHK